MHRNCLWDQTLSLFLSWFPFASSITAPIVNNTPKRSMTASYLFYQTLFTCTLKRCLLHDFLCQLAVHRRSNLFDKRFFLRTLGCYCVSCELLYASIADALLFVNILVSGIFHGRFAQRLAVNKPCLQIIRRLLWKQATTHSLRNNNPMFAGRTSCQTN